MKIVENIFLKNPPASLFGVCACARECKGKKTIQNKTKDRAWEN